MSASFYEVTLLWAHDIMSAHFDERTLHFNKRKLFQRKLFQRKLF